MGPNLQAGKPADDGAIHKVAEQEGAEFEGCYIRTGRGAEVEAPSELLFQRSNSRDLEPEIVKMDLISCTGQEACDKMEISLSLWILEILDFKTC